MLVYSLAIIPLLQHREKVRPIAAQLDAAIPPNESLYAIDPDYQPFLLPPAADCLRRRGRRSAARRALPFGPAGGRKRGDAFRALGTATGGADPADQRLSGTPCHPLAGGKQFRSAGLTSGLVIEFVSMLTMSEIDPETVGQLLHETARVWRHKLDQRLQPLGLSQAKWRTIAHLARGQMTQHDLAERLSIEEPTLARTAHPPRKWWLDQARERAARSALQDRSLATQVEPASARDRGDRARAAPRNLGNDFTA